MSDIEKTIKSAVSDMNICYDTVRVVELEVHGKLYRVTIVKKKEDGK